MFLLFALLHGALSLFLLSQVKDGALHAHLNIRITGQLFMVIGPISTSFMWGRGRSHFRILRQWKQIEFATPLPQLILNQINSILIEQG